LNELLEFDHVQADKLRRRLTNKKNSIQTALNKIEGLVERTANLHWEGKSRAEYINLYKASSAKVDSSMRRWLKEVTDLINRAKEEKLKQEEPGNVRKPRQLIEHMPDNDLKYVAGPAATADGQANHGAANCDGVANEGADGQAGRGAANYDSSLNERAERGDRQISLSEVMNGDLGYWYEPRADKWFERLRIYDPAPTIIIREIEPPERKPVSEAQQGAQQGAQQEAQSSATSDWPQSAPAGIPEVTEREIYYALVQSYAGPADTLGYKICDDSPDDLLDSLTQETCLISPEQLDVYNSVIAAGSYTDEQKRRMLISMALETNINDLLDMDDYDKADALKGLMDRMNSQSEDAYNRFQVMFNIKWSCFNDINESIIYSITNHAERLLLSTPENSQRPTGYSNTEHLAKLGYTETEISDLRNWMTEAEWEFFNKLDGTEEGYISAFQTDPNDLSEVVTLALTRYSARLLEFDEEGKATQESCRQIELFTNAILKADNAYIFIAEDGTKQLTTEKYSDIYLRRMYAGAAVETEGAAFMLAGMDIGTQEYQELYKEYRAKYSMVSFWASQNLIIDEVKRRNLRSMGYADVLLPKISNLQFIEGEAQFRYTHAGGDKNEKVTTDLIETGSIMKSIYNQQTLRQLQKAKDAVFFYTIASMAQGGFLMLTGIMSPPLAILASLLFMAMNGKAGTVTGLDSFVESNAAVTGVKSGNLIAAELINGAIRWQKANQELDVENYKQKMEYFGSGGTFELSSDDPLNMFEDVTKISFVGLYNPDVIRNMYTWQTEGIKGWANLTEEKSKIIIDKIAERYEIGSQIYKDCYALMYGGYDIFGIGVKETEDGVGNDMSRFTDAIAAFGKENYDVKANWDNLFIEEEVE